MEQLLAHLIGDYWLQTGWMAKNKERNSLAAFVHVVAYSVPFLFLRPSMLQCVLIVGTHFFIDRFALAKRMASWKISPGTPAYITDWLLIIHDNSLHLLLNYLILAYL